MPKVLCGGSPNTALVHICRDRLVYVAVVTKDCPPLLVYDVDLKITESRCSQIFTVCCGDTAAVSRIRISNIPTQVPYRRRATRKFLCRVFAAGRNVWLIGNILILMVLSMSYSSRCFCVQVAYRVNITLCNFEIFSTSDDIDHNRSQTHILWVSHTETHQNFNFTFSKSHHFTVNTSVSSNGQFSSHDIGTFRLVSVGDRWTGMQKYMTMICNLLN